LACCGMRILIPFFFSVVTVGIAGLVALFIDFSALVVLKTC